ncbi:Multidrug resistance protein Stp [Fusarium oxysporum f. sp. albedinis]|nr:Multidrug resistance protein Stp [Fusarium oxysporum f. sp. albedinis]
MQLVLSLLDLVCLDNPDDGSSSGFPSCKDDIDADTAAAGRASLDNAGESATGIASTCINSDDKYKIPLYR